ncbi:tRNA (adenosine(37)-N6)-threonylcarbamoyltransferase complex dimerization subunit type 1 TsaB [Micrococcoides hystricis]|uniref:tRNA (Adenosine(37)-N6)-threonylcarbamoyltransferase complex dimerization subunit type 1 TsaB n=1 Tax=Micrococcoides hystricis TaxID=1572761 RepID=A0ABV6PC12_9MICC
MKLLVIDTAATTSVALIAAPDDGTGPATVLAEQTTESSTDHAEQLSVTVAEVLAAAHLEPSGLTGIVSGVGPGPFTGLRVGMVAASAYAFGWSLPLHGVMSLDALALPAAAALHHAAETEFLVAADARRREVYWAHYRLPRAENNLAASFQPELVAGPFVGPAQDIPAELRQLPAFGPGTTLYPEAFPNVAEPAPHAGVAATEQEHGPASHLGMRAAHLLAHHPEQLLPQIPLYLRESDAKIPTNQRWARNV